MPHFWGNKLLDSYRRQSMFGMTCAGRSMSGEDHTEELTADVDTVNAMELPAHISWGQWTMPTTTTAQTTPATSTSSGLLTSDTTPSGTNAISLLAPGRFKATEISSGGKFQPIRDNVFCINHNVKYNKPKHQHDWKRKWIRMSRGAAQPEAEKQKGREPRMSHSKRFGPELASMGAWHSTSAVRRHQALALFRALFYCGDD